MNNKYNAVQIGRQFLRINTSNPPGNEEKAILFLEDILKKGFLIRDLQTYSSSGIKFIIMILENPFTKDICESIIDELKDKYPANILLS